VIVGSEDLVKDNDLTKTIQSIKNKLSHQSSESDSEQDTKRKRRRHDSDS
jgi:hypothetical protein